MKFTIDSKSKRRIDDNGFMHVESCNISKECINPYLGVEIANYQNLGLDPQKVYQVYRKGEELAKAASTFNGLPLLLGHFEESAAKPQKMHRVGSLGTDCFFEAPYLKVTLIITDQKAIDKVENGDAVEISCGYGFEPVFEKGNFNNESYDFWMSDIRGNHVALVPEGRAGSDVRVADEVTASAREAVQHKERLKIKDLQSNNGGCAPHANHLTKGSDMNALQKARMAFDELKKNLLKAKDEGATGEAIEEMEALLTKSQLQLQRIEAESEGKNPADFDINEDGLDEASMDAMKACDLDVENPAVKKAWAEGVKYGEKLIRNPEERKKIDREHESEGEKKALGEDEETQGTKDTKDTDTKDMETKKTADAKSVAFDAAKLGRDIEAKLKAKNEAANFVRPLIGKVVDPYAFDSAEAIYMHACKIKGAIADAASAKDVCAVLRKTQSQKFTTADSVSANPLADIGLGE